MLLEKIKGFIQRLIIRGQTYMLGTLDFMGLEILGAQLLLLKYSLDLTKTQYKMVYYPSGSLSISYGLSKDNFFKHQDL